jgi:RNA polymerase sigma-70 factor (ECF subfamily)
MDHATRSAPRDDATVLALIAAGDQDAMVEFNARWFPQFLTLATYLTRNAQDGEDIALEVVLRVLAAPSRFRPTEGSVRSWLLSAVRNLAYDYVRRRQVRKAATLSEPDDDARAIDIPDDEPTAQDRAEARERSAAVQAALAKLGENDREVLLLRDYEGLKAPEVARALGLSVEKVGSRLHRARRRFAALLRTDWPELFPYDDSGG